MLASEPEAKHLFIASKRRSDMRGHIQLITHSFIYGTETSFKIFRKYFNVANIRIAKAVKM